MIYLLSDGQLEIEASTYFLEIFSLFCCKIREIEAVAKNLNPLRYCFLSYLDSYATICV